MVVCCIRAWSLKKVFLYLNSHAHHLKNKKEEYKLSEAIYIIIGLTAGLLVLAGVGAGICCCHSCCSKNSPNHSAANGP